MKGTLPSAGQFDLLRAFLSNQSSQTGLEDKLRKWAQPPSETEGEKCERAVRMVRQAIDNDPKLSKLNIEVFSKGSFHNRTNVPSDSDVDVGVLAKDYYFNEYPPGTTSATFGFFDAAYTYQQFRDDVAAAIKTKFGEDSVSVGNKAIQVHANTARVDADVVPHMVHRRYYADRTYDEGVALRSSDGTLIYNWPSQDYDNGVQKNETTKKRYKAFVRIFKNLRGEMKERGFASANTVASYLIACLAYNIPSFIFDEALYETMVENCLTYLHRELSDLRNVVVWTEINEMKKLFGPHQGWKSDEVADFVSDALKYFRGLKA